MNKRVMKVDENSEQEAKGNTRIQECNRNDAYF